MASDKQPNTTVDRRTILRHLATGTVATYGGVGVVGGQGSSDTPDGPASGTYRAPVADVQGLRQASVKIHEDGSVTRHLRVDLDAAKDAGGEERSGQSYSVGLDLPSDPDDRAATLAAATPGQSGPGARVESAEHPGKGNGARKRPGNGRAVETHSHNDPGMPDEVDLTTGSKGYGVFGQTESQECGPLARTKLLSDLYYGYFANTGTETQTVDGNACSGHVWDSKFRDFCELYVTEPCTVPSAFNTTWYTRTSVGSAGRGGTLFACPDFPVIPDNVATAQYMVMHYTSGSPTVDFYQGSCATPAEWWTWDLDRNGLANLGSYGLASLLGVPTAGYSTAMANWLLAYDAGPI